MKGLLRSSCCVCLSACSGSSSETPRPASLGAGEGHLKTSSSSWWLFGPLAKSGKPGFFPQGPAHSYPGIWGGKGPGSASACPAGKGGFQATVWSVQAPRAVGPEESRGRGDTTFPQSPGHPPCPSINAEAKQPILKEVSPE